MAGNPITESFRSLRRSRVSPTKNVGAMGTAVYGGYVQTPEDSSDLAGDRKFKTYGEILANTAIVAAGVRYFLNVLSKGNWTFTPSEADTDGRFAELAEQMLTEDPATPWHRIVRRAGMYRFHGFSVQEWTARRHEDGHFTLKDVSPRAQNSIERWDIDFETGEVRGIVQRTPQQQIDVYLPRGKVVYMVDDSLSDSPEGLGLFRHLVKPAKALRRLEQLEGIGFETDLRGIPVARGPFAALAAQVNAGTITQADRIALEKPIQDFVENHIRTAKSGLLLDSAQYRDLSADARISSTPQWDIELLTGSSTSLPALNTAIQRLNTEMARILGVEQLLLGGGDSGGAYALSKDKTEAFFLIVNSTLEEIRQNICDDLLVPMWLLNGWDLDTMPEVGIEEVNFSDVQMITSALRDLAQAGAPLDPDDPAIDEVRAILGLSPQPDRSSDLDEDAGIGGNSVRDGLADASGEEDEITGVDPSAAD